LLARSNPMLDVVFVAIAVIVLGAAALYAVACEHM
jgi:hypothetical protein